MATNGLVENLRFLLLEVTQQLRRSRQFLKRPSPDLYESVFNKEEYVNNLKSIIQRKCFASLQGEVDEVAIAQAKAIDITASNLERIADYCKNLIEQARGIDEEVLDEEDYGPLFDAVEVGLAEVEGAIFNRDTQAALEICETEATLDRLYRKIFSRILDDLRRTEHTRSLVSSMFIYRYLERMGDSLLNVGEAIVSLSVGESIRISRLRSIQDMIDVDDLEPTNGDESQEGAAVVLEPVAETRSGCKISRLRVSSGDQAGMMMIVKDGRLKKVLDEKASNDRWQEISPGLAPQVYSYSSEGDHGTLLVEYLPGQTFQQILLSGSREELGQATESLCQTLDALWQKTLESKPVSARFMRQVRKRLGAVQAVHPEFTNGARTLGRKTVAGLEDLLNEATAVEARCEAPFSVYIHGDLNLDNIILEKGQERVHFIDLHRSRMLDYVQDVSVFIVSNLRLQVFDIPLRRRLRAVALRFMEFGRSFAERNGDATFETRLGLGLARSFLTSTRFILDPELARWHYLRGRFLLERLVQGDVESFRVPPELFVD